MTATWFVVCGAFASAQEPAPSESRPASAPSADDPADVARVCELYDEARSALDEEGFGSAMTLIAEADVERSRLLRGDHPHVADALSRLGVRLYQSGRAADALAVLDAAREIRERVYGPDHPDVADCLNSVAVCLGALGRAAEALPRYEAALAIQERRQSDDHPIVAQSLSNVAGCLLALGREAEALPLYEAARAMRVRLFRGDHPAVARSLRNVAYCLEALGRAREALPLYEASRAMRERLNEGDRPEIADGLDDLASCLDALGRTAEALPLYEKARAMRARLHRGDHASLAVSLNNVAVCLAALGRPPEALTLFEAARAMRERLYAGDHPDVASSLNNVAGCLNALGRAAEALPLFDAARAMWERTHLGDHPDVATSLNNVAACLQALGRPAEALPWFEAARAMWERLYAGDHPNVAASLNNVADCLYSLGRAAEAARLHNAAADMARRGRYPNLGLYLTESAASATALGDLPRAAALLSEGADAYEARRSDAARLSNRDRGAYEGKLGGRRIYAALSKARLRLGDVEAALAALENGRGRAALDLLALARREPLGEARRVASEAGDAAKVAAIDAVAAAIAAAESDVARWAHAETTVYARKDFDDAGRSAELAKIGAAANAARIALQAAETGHTRLIAEIVPLGKPATVRAARSLITGKERMLTYFVGETESHVYLLRPPHGGVAVHPLAWADGRAVTAPDLGVAVGEYLRGIADEGRAAPVRGIDEKASAASRTAGTSSSEIGRRLFAALMPEAVWAEVRDAGRIEVSADGALHRLPFEALVVEDAPTVADRRYWLDVGPQIVYATSASTSLEARRLRDAQKGGAAPAYEVLAVGDPIYAPAESAASRAKPPTEGALIVRVADGSAGAAAGLRRGDVVTRYGARAVSNAKGLGEAEESVAAAMKDLAVDSPKEIVLEVWRPDGVVRLTVAPGALGVEVAQDPPPAAWAALAAGDEAAVAAVERTGVLGRSGVLAPLPGTRREVETIRRTVEGLADPVRGRLKAKVLLGAEATETRVFTEAPKARILHFATHYLPEETDDGSFSALALTAPALPSRDDDGFLRIHDVLNRWAGRLSAVELVVLSACDSFGTRAALEDSISAMPIALLFAGVPSVVSSLWRVEDQSTADLMSDFYRRLFDPAANAATADRPAPTRLEHFTAARKAARARRPEPYFWAPFVWMGDPR